MAAIPIDLLRQFPFMAAFDDALLARIGRQLHRQHCQAGASVFAQNDESRDVYWVVSGHLRLTTYSLAGREVVFHDLFKGDIVGELSAIDGRPRAANLVAIAESELLCMEAAVFNRLTREHTVFAMAVIDRLTGLARKLNSRIYQLTAPVPMRICTEILRLALSRHSSGNSVRIAPAPKHLDIANRVNTHREAVSRTLSDLQRHQVLRRGRGELLVLDLQALRACAEGATLRLAAAGAAAGQAGQRA